MGARFKLDENIPRDAQALLLAAGHDVHTVVEERLAGRADPDILDVCSAEGRILVTLDLDFADIRAYPPAGHRGIWVLRPESQAVERTLAVLRGALAMLATEPAERRLWIVEPRRVRISS